jgi:hypothetical protein
MQQYKWVKWVCFMQSSGNFTWHGNWMSHTGACAGVPMLATCCSDTGRAHWLQLMLWLTHDWVPNKSLAQGSKLATVACQSAGSELATVAC